MRNLIILTLCLLLFSNSVISQTKTVEGYTGDSYNIIIQFYGDYFTVQRNDGYAVINLDGTVMASGIKPAVIGMTRKMSLYHQTLIADESGNAVLKDLKGNTLSTGKYKEIVPFVSDNTVAEVRSEPGTWIVAYVDTAGKEITRIDVKKYKPLIQSLNKSGGLYVATLSDFIPFSEGLTPVKSRVNNKYGFIDKKLNVVIPFSFKMARPFSDGMAAVQNEDGNWGYINTQGKLIIPFVYSRTPSRFMYGFARVESSNGLWGYINKENKIVIPPKYEHGTVFYKGYALVRENYNQPALLIDSTGSTIASFPNKASYIDDAMPSPGIMGLERFEYPFYVSETLKQLVDEGKGIFKSGMTYGLLDKKGKVILDFAYQHLSEYHNGKLFAHKSSFVNNSTQNKFGILNDQGEWAIEVVKPVF